MRAPPDSPRPQIRAHARKPGEPAQPPRAVASAPPQQAAAPVHAGGPSVQAPTISPVPVAPSAAPAASAAVPSPPALASSDPLASPQAGQPDTNRLYDRADPAASGRGKAKRFSSSRTGAQIRSKRNVERVGRPTIAVTQPAQRVIVMPRQAPEVSGNERGGWRRDYYDDWRGSATDSAGGFSGRDNWRD